MSSPEPCSAPHSGLRAVARASIAYGLRQGRPAQLDLDLYPAELLVARASFVTLHLGGELRGCTGNLEPDGPLVVGVAHNAFRSAFSDPRFAPLAEVELDSLEISVCVLSPLEPLSARSEEDLVAKLRPGIDGLVLREGAHGATFLPCVWEDLPTPRAFLHALERKAGLVPGEWSSTRRFERYTTEPAD
jgi:AmmeMemoRadiSam system protein A